MAPRAPVAKLFASILAPNAIARLERWAVVEQATQAQLDAFVEGLYSILATIDRLAGQTTQRRAFRKPELASTVSAKPVVGAYVPPSISAVSPAQVSSGRAPIAAALDEERGGQTCCRAAVQHSPSSLSHTFLLCPPLPAHP